MVFIWWNANKVDPQITESALNKDQILQFTHRLQTYLNSAAAYAATEHPVISWRIKVHLTV